MGIYESFLKLAERFLSNTSQCVVLNGQASSWDEYKAGVSKGSILSTLFLLIYINNLPENLKSTAKPFEEMHQYLILSRIPEVSCNFKPWPKILNGLLQMENDA